MSEKKEPVIVGFADHDCPHCFILNLMNMILEVRPELKYKRVVGETLHALVDFIHLNALDLNKETEPCIDALRRYFQDAVAAQPVSLTPGSFIAPGSKTHQ